MTHVSHRMSAALLDHTAYIHLLLVLGIVLELLTFTGQDLMSTLTSISSNQ